MKELVCCVVVLIMFRFASNAQTEVPGGNGSPADSLSKSALAQDTTVKNGRNDFSKLTYQDGRNDAIRFYKGYKAAGTASFCGGIMTIYGLPIPIATSLSKPANAPKFAPNPQAYYANQEYAQGFNFEASRLKTNKIWMNYGIGAATSTGLALAFAIALLLAWTGGGN